MAELKALAKFDPLSQRIAKAIAPMGALEIHDQTSKDQAMQALAVIKGYSVEVEAVHEALKRPLLEMGRQVDAKKKSVLEPLSAMKTLLTRKLTSYQAKIDADLAAERRRIEEERRANQAKALRELEAAAALSENREALREQEAAIRSDANEREAELQAEKADVNAEAVKGLRHNWKFKVIEPDQVKPEYRCPDEKLIGQIVRNKGAQAAKLIGGIEVWDEPSISSGAIAPPSAKSRRFQ